MQNDARKLSSLIKKAQGGDLVAYDEIVHRFQNVAVALAFSVLGDRALAEDAAQEAFIEAFLCLSKLQNPDAFSGWLRRIVFKHCNRITRRKSFSIVALDAAEDVGGGDEPYFLAERSESALQLHTAIAALPEHERVVTLLFYMGEYSHRHIAEFLEVPTTTVKKRLHTARKKLKEKMMNSMQEMAEQNPSRDSQFATSVAENVAASLADFAAGDGGETEICSHYTDARYHHGQPISRLFDSLLGWALVRGAHEIHFAPTSAGLEVCFRVEGTTEQVATLPKSLQEPLAVRLKWMSDLDVTTTQAQSGIIFVYWESVDKNYDVSVSFAPTRNGENVVLSFVAK